MSDIDELVKRLRSTRTEQGGLWPIPNLHEEAADALEAQVKEIAGLEYEAKLFDEALGVASARIAELEAALKPFVDELDEQEIEVPHLTNGDGVIHNYGLRLRHLRAARAVMGRKDD